jgi:hypothetical protein
LFAKPVRKGNTVQVFERRPTMANLVRVFASERGVTIGDVSFAITPPPDIDVVVEVEASAAEFEAAAAYRVSGFVRDYQSCNVEPLGPKDGALGDANWPTRNAEFVFPLPGNILDIAQVNGIVELVASVRVGAAKTGAAADLDTGIFTWVAA